MGSASLPSLREWAPLRTLRVLRASTRTARLIFSAMKQFFESLPRDLEESAKIDGAGTIQTYFKIMLPLARPS
ncbi:MAG: carbohydrate ABC transporter permease, partial [Firmicutes bacterium]|nr:carbohydrate ABC transporter permease [Bacillota bacterium]